MAAGRPDRSYPKTYRLASSEDFRRVYRNARRGGSGPFAWHARPNGGLHARLGLAVPKRVVKRATDRSRLKRLIRESFRHNRGRLPAVDIIVSVKTLPADVRDPVLHTEITRVWEGVLSKLGEAQQYVVKTHLE